MPKAKKDNVKKKAVKKAVKAKKNTAPKVEVAKKKTPIKVVEQEKPARKKRKKKVKKQVFENPENIKEIIKKTKPSGRTFGPVKPPKVQLKVAKKSITKEEMVDICKKMRQNYGRFACVERLCRISNSCKNRKGIMGDFMDTNQILHDKHGCMLEDDFQTRFIIRMRRFDDIDFGEKVDE